jgi:hypothetical protein
MEMNEMTTRQSFLRATRRSNAEAQINLAQRRVWHADGVLIKEGWANLLEPGIREWFFVGADRVPSLLDTQYDVLGSTRDTEHMQGVGAVSPDAWEEYSKTGIVPMVSFDAGYEKTFTHTTYLVELPIKVELIEDNQYANVIDAAQQLGEAAQLKREVDRASLYNNAFNSSFLGPDAVALCSNSHPNGPENAGVTQDNNFTLALTKDNVSTIRQNMMAFTDDKGSLISVIPDTLVVPPELEDAAIVIAQSLLDPTSGNNAINPQSGRWKVEVDHYLTDANAWFMVDSIKRKRHVKWFNRVPMSAVLDRVVSRAFAVYNARMRYSFGWRHWTWIAGSNPS